MSDVLAILWVCFLFFMAGWSWGRNHERSLISGHTGPNWRVHVADDGTLWAERTNGSPLFVGPCEDANELVNAITENRDPPPSSSRGTA